MFFSCPGLVSAIAHNVCSHLPSYAVACQPIHSDLMQQMNPISQQLAFSIVEQIERNDFFPRQRQEQTPANIVFTA
jgi:hypothetical protein